MRLSNQIHKRKSQIEALQSTHSLGGIETIPQNKKQHQLVPSKHKLPPLSPDLNAGVGK